VSAIARGDAVALARALVRVDSRNPGLEPDGPGEGDAARALAEVLASWGFDVLLDEVLPGRPNVVARVGAGRGRSLMLNGHLDVVGTAGMTHAPFAAEESDGRLYGRGSADMKGGIAAMCAAAARAAARGVGGEVIIAAVIDEELDSAGTRALLERGVRADAAIVTEPTRLAVMPAHRGFAWVEARLTGRAAHGSRYDIGVDAIRGAGLVLAELDAHERDVLTRRTHDLLGRGSLHASSIAGGLGLSTYPDRCVLRVERRTLPGESARDALDEVRAACERAAARLPGLGFEISLIGAQGPSDVSTEAPIVRELVRAMEAAGVESRIAGMSAWTDAALLNEAGIPAICFGPGDIALAHAAEEWIDTREIERATSVLTTLIERWCSEREGS
jgi:acetylornithine deacetylase